MKLHLITVGEPKLVYAKAGWQEYTKRLGHFHTLRYSHLADKHANDASQLLQAAGKAYVVALVIEGQQLTSQQLSDFLDKRALEGREVCFIIGGPDGLPAEVIAAADFQWSLSQLTLPHDLAMVVMAETLYRASTIGAGHPYHRS